MQEGHMLLGRPGKFDRKFVHDGYKNTYSLVQTEKKITLRPLTPKKAHENQIHIKEKLEKREKEMREEENKEGVNKGKDKSECERKEMNKSKGVEKQEKSGK